MPDTGDVRLRHKIDVHTYYRMGEAGIFQPDDRVELIEGELIDMAPIGDEHAAAVTALTKAAASCAARGVATGRGRGVFPPI